MEHCCHSMTVNMLWLHWHRQMDVATHESSGAQSDECIDWSVCHWQTVNHSYVTLTKTPCGDHFLSVSYLYLDATFRWLKVKHLLEHYPEWFALVLLPSVFCSWCFYSLVINQAASAICLLINLSIVAFVHCVLWLGNIQLNSIFITEIRWYAFIHMRMKRTTNWFELILT